LEIIGFFQRYAKDVVYLDAIEAETMDRYVKWRVKQVKPSTVNGDLVVLNGMFKLAAEKGLISVNPIPKVKRLPVKPKKVSSSTNSKGLFYLTIAV